ncbi:hydroxymethylbilane synthase [Persicobacter diffluens]|uniref:Porphobilinogen deaminase n=1 Tax=Persicobacter diffluens TaxID=981 RepID=A0AAN4VWV6_9BACT|nr:porphobilinogen deaminase [Persicobacter diffluens]
MKVRIGTRGSKLALWQAYFVQDALQKGGLETEIVKIETKGDKILDVSIHKIGSKGVFTEEIEEQLNDGRIDIAVHSAKDMQSELPEGFELISFSERETPNDVIVSKDKSLTLDSGKKFRLGTSSNRRVATLRRYYPHIEIVPIRGNLQRRIQKMEEGQCDALLLAYAGVHRMEYDDLIVEKLPLDRFTPAVGQGSVAIEASVKLDPALRAKIRESLNHEPTEKLLLAERAFLRRLQGGCSVPVYGLAQWEGAQVKLVGGIIGLQGEKQIEASAMTTPEEVEEMGTAVAEDLIGQGGDQMLKEIKAQL